MIRGLFGRLLVVMCGVAAASTVLVLVLQERSLSRDLERAAQRRLDAAATAAERLLDGHLEALSDRYRAVSGTPQFRATLEIRDGPTLSHYAQSLLHRHGATRIAFVDARGRVAGGAGDRALDETALAVHGAAVVAQGGAVRAVVEVDLGSSGRLVAVEPVGDELLQRWSELCGARVSFGPPDVAPDGELVRVVRPVPPFEMRIASSLAAERGAMRNARRSLLAAGGLGLLLAFLVSLVVSRGLVRPIQRVQAAARRIGAGDLTTEVETRRRDEIGDVARSFGDMSRELRVTIRRVVDAADRVEGTAGSIGLGTRRLLGVADAQQRGNDEAAATLTAIHERVQAIAAAAGDSTRRLDASVDGSTDSFRELAASGRRLEQSAEALGLRSNEITGSIQQVSLSARQVAQDTEALLPAVDAAVERVNEMAEVARTVNSHADETARLSAGVVESAEEGRGVVREAVEGMESTRDTIRESERVIGVLCERVEQISSILEVIDDVTDETRLLALNGAIIAAQAGRHGRAFSVVAEQLRALASRVRKSTEQIHEVVSAVQVETSNVVESITRGSRRAEAGAGRIQEAEAALSAITRAARESTDRMAESVSATARQMAMALAVAEEMGDVRGGVDRIRSVTREQAEATGRVRHGADALLAVVSEVETTVALQTRGAAQIGEGIEAVQGAVREITSGLEEQAAASDQVASVVRDASRYGRAQEESAAEIERFARELEGQAEALRGAVRGFRIEP